MSVTSPSSSDGLNLQATDAWRGWLRDWSVAAHDYSTLVRLSRQGEKLATVAEIERRLVPVRLAVVSTATADFFLPILKGALLRAGLRPSLYVAPYGQVTPSLLSADGPLATFRPQVTLIANATAHMPGWPSLDASLDDVQQQVDDVCRSLLDPCAVFHERTGSEIVLDNFHAFSWRASGNFGAKLPGDPTTFVRRLNLALGDRAPRFVHVNDVAALAERRGLETWFDERYWYLAKQAVSFDCVPDYCRSLASIIGAILGRSKKCLLLDLDNTLWGGVVGDDGLAGIQIGEGSGEGEAFKAFQTYLKQLKDRGVLLAVCSKNDDSIARSAFTDHPDMVLRLDDFVVFKANWEPKSGNIRAIAREMDLPLESFVFVDDNPAEREEVAQALPEVTIPAMPDDAAGFVRALDAERLFEVVALTTEDLQRTATYHARRETLDALGGATDVGAYLASLLMTASVRPFEPVSFERITQLVNKTNQFNLTTPRVVPAEIERLASDPRTVTFSVRLQDRFADHGLISVFFAHADGPALVIDAWLMSCRVLGRGVERLLFNHVLAAARERTLSEIVGEYKPTDRNMLVKDHYAGLGFTRDGGDGTSERWRLRVADATPLENCIDAGTAAREPRASQ
ncbi:MAG TPA: HAD-IIIC family phosphatase [Vicinamibacterales bacterium]|nr:HAD-IIIC family phosphatase [Vicinamibacterales bacterium]